LFEGDDYNNSTEVHKFKCLKHDKEFYSNVYNIIYEDFNQCPKCKYRGISMQEKEVVSFIKSVYNGEVIENSRQIIPPYEVDIWIPEFNLGIEYCGLYWHSSANENFKKNVHRDKAKLMHDKGYNFFLFFEDEWKNKRLLIEQMIKYRLKLVKNKVYARQCELKIYDTASELKEFFIKNHIDGYSNSTKGFALIYNNEIMAAMTLRTNFNSETEICRFATNGEYVVAGAGSKLISLLPKPITTYSNNRLSNGNIYRNNGFEEITKTINPSYYYTDLNERVWRYRCKRLNPPKITQEEFDKSPTELSQATNGVFSKKIFGDERPLYRIEDCGHVKWLLR
jgi:hypothetical protein